MIHLICNAHIDPVWLWEWEEGIAAALSTFRAAADFCEEYDGFVFNHNEALLYEYIEQLDPPLFERIRALVKAGRWAVMGGWYLQPDCNMPSGESILRQIEAGQVWFSRKLGIRFGPGGVETAVNLDPFGHSRGLVQLLQKTGYTSYLICRPAPGSPGAELPGDLFNWVGADGSRVKVFRVPGMYNSGLGKVEEKIAAFLRDEQENRDPGLLLWGVGNHGGGPSRRDIETIAELAVREPLVHSTPERFFREYAQRAVPGPELEKTHTGGINPWGTGCYTSQIRIKQKHRELENLLYSVEKLAVHASILEPAAYPQTELAAAQRDLLIMEFHDILPGSGIEAVEEYALELAGHGLQMLKQVRFRLLCALLGREKPIPPGACPVYACNPHPYAVRGIFELELQLADQNRSGTSTRFTLLQQLRQADAGPAAEREVPCQVEKEASNIPIDWRKKISFAALLQPGLNRFIAWPKVSLQAGGDVPEMAGCTPETAEPAARDDAYLRFSTEAMTVAISRKTGLIESLMIAGCELIGSEGIVPVVLGAGDDPWAMEEPGNQPEKGRFRLMIAGEASAFRGIPEAVNPPPVTVIEAGPVRHVVEVLMHYGQSDLVLTYRIPREGTGLELNIRVFWHELHARLKLRIPTAFPRERRHCLTQIMAGREDLAPMNMERVGRQWAAVHNGEHALAVINNGTYGLDFDESVLRLSLLHSPAYAAHPVDDREIVRKDRWSPRIDHGVRDFRFRIVGGDRDTVLNTIDREAQTWNEAPYLLSVFPTSRGSAAVPPDVPVRLDGEGILLLSLRSGTAEREAAIPESRSLMLHLQESAGRAVRGRISFPALDQDLWHEIELGPYETAAFRYGIAAGMLVKCDRLTSSE